MENQIAELLERLPGAFLPEEAGNTSATIHLKLSGEEGGEWTIQIDGGKCDILPGPVEKPTLTFSASARDCLEVFSGKQDPMRAYMAGRLHLKGNMGLAMRLARLFSIEKIL